MRWTTPTIAGSCSALLAAAVTASPAGAAGASFGSGPFQFTPLTSSHICTTPGGNGNQPFVLPQGYAQTVVAQEGDPGFQDLPDMNTLNETGPQAGRYLYRTHEVGANGSISVTDLRTGVNRLVAQRADWEALDGLVWTPWQTLLMAEERIISTFKDPAAPNAKGGHVYEVDPTTGAATLREAVGSRSHEGLRFDRQGNLYGISENATGYIYKFTPDTKGDLASGESYALKVVEGTKAEGTFEWAPLDRELVKTDSDAAAAAVQATVFQRPEDVEISTSTGNSKGGQIMYVAATTEDTVYGVDLTAKRIAQFVKDGVTPGTEGGAAPGVDVFNSPDNLALDKAGNLYIAEDPGGNFPVKTTGDDIWVGIPSASDPLLATKVGRFASTTDCDAEPTGIYFDASGQTLYVNAMHRGGDRTDYAMAVTRQR